MPEWSGRPDRLHSCHNVLVLDDDDDAREAMVFMLDTEGFDVVGAASGAEALALMQGGIRPCVAILDLRMPDIDGWEVWERMKAHDELARTAVIILSADPADHVRAKAVGVREFLRKPIDGRALTEAVERHCDRRR